MKISRNSWHYQMLLGWHGSSVYIADTACGYVWQLVSMVLLWLTVGWWLVPIMWVCIRLHGVFCKRIEFTDEDAK